MGKHIQWADRGLMWILGFLGAVSAATLSASPEPESGEAPAGFHRPPGALEAAATASRPSALGTDSDRRRILVTEAADLVPVAELGWPEARIGALRYYPRAGARVNALDYLRLGVCDLRGEGCIWLENSEGERLRYPQFTPEGDGLVFARLHARGMEIRYVSLVDAFSTDVTPPEKAPLTSRVLSELSLHDLLGPPCRLDPTGESMVCTVRPAGADRGFEALEPVVSAPEIRDSTSSGAARAGSMRLADLRSKVTRIFWHGRTEPVAEIGLWRSAVPSPDGESMLLEAVGTTSARFQVRSASGAGATDATRPLASRGEVRNVSWRPDRAQTLVWIERDAEGYDQVRSWAKPFEGQPRLLFSVRQSASGSGTQGSETVSRLLWGGPPATLLVETTRGDGAAGTGELSRYAVRLGASASDETTSDETTGPVLLARWSAAVTGGDPAVPLTRPGAHGEVALLSGDGDLWIRGGELGAAGPMPTLGLQDLRSGQVRTLRQNPEGVFERPLTVTDAGEVLVVREVPGRPSNLFLYLGIDTDEGPRSVTGWDHPIPELAAVEHVVLNYERRPDGLPLAADLYLPPPSLRGEGPLPALFWAYPRNYSNRAQAARDTRPAARSLRLDPLSPLLWTLRGYAVLEADMPIVGRGDSPANDTWLSQLQAGAEAAVSAVEKHGVDPNALTVVGHSYGAHMAVSLLAHTDLFRAGIALSGAYNRTTTPFGFQQESRTLWQAEEVYRRMSPIFDADQIHEPLLLIHGRDDSRRATRAEESERLYEALRGLERPARLVLLHAEGHRPRGRESVLHLLWEMDRWLGLHGTAGP